MDDVKPIYSFKGLKSLLTDMGYSIDKATPYKPISNPIDVGIKELSESFNFSDDGIFYVDASGVERQVYLYKRNYHLELYGKPRYHICKCATIDSFIASDSFESEYRASNTEKVPVANMDDDYSEEIVENLPLCRHCMNRMGEKRAIASNEFVALLKRVDEYHNKRGALLGVETHDKNRSNKNIDVDILGYTKDWEEVRQRYMEEQNFTCEKCGIRIDELSDLYYMHVHHINGNRTDNRSANLRCLCIRCHSRVNTAHKKLFSQGANRVALDDFNNKYPEEGEAL